MAKQIIESMTDDIDGTPGAETVTFAVDGTSYEIDLSDTNAKELRGALAGYVESARKVTTARNGSRPSRTSARTDREHTQKIREWARGQGITVADRGRINANTVAAYNAGNPQLATT